MGFTTLAVTAPHATAYDEDYPTRSTENYSHALHDILQDMEDATGDWYLTDNVITNTEKNNIASQMYDMVEAVWDYAHDAIVGWRATETPGLSKPLYSSIGRPVELKYTPFVERQWDVYFQCIQMMFKIYYMWESEEDPLLLKEKLQELLIAWPLTDLTVELNTEAGQEMKIYPSWKNVDL